MSIEDALKMASGVLVVATAAVYALGGYMERRHLRLAAEHERGALPSTEFPPTPLERSNARLQRELDELREENQRLRDERGYR